MTFSSFFLHTQTRNLACENKITGSWYEYMLYRREMREMISLYLTGKVRRI